MSIGTPFQNQGREPNDWLRHEIDPHFTRENIVVKTGAGKVVTGTPIAKLDGEDKYVPYDPSASDGRQTLTGILLYYVDATDADKGGVMIKGNVTIAPMYLTWHSSVDDDTKKAAGVAALEALGMSARAVV